MLAMHLRAPLAFVALACALAVSTASADESAEFCLPVPYRSQADGTVWAASNCGPTAIAMVLEAYGLDVPTTKLRQRANQLLGISDPSTGTRIQDLARIGERCRRRPGRPERRGTPPRWLRWVRFVVLWLATTMKQERGSTMSEPLSATTTLKGGMAFESVAGSGHTVMMDADRSVGGSDQGFRPMELLLVGLTGCTGMDVISILRKMQQQVVDYQVKAEGSRAEEHPRVYTEIAVEHVVNGKKLDPERVRRAVELSATRYCSVSAMLSKAARITHKYRIIDTETGAEVAGILS